MDPCVYLHFDGILVMYINSILLLSCHLEVLDKVVSDLKIDFILEDKGEEETLYLGVSVTHNEKNGMTTLTRPKLIQQVLQIFAMDDESIEKNGSH